MIKKYHKYLGLLMLLPFIAWAVTGVFFFIKPGYSSAYESLPVKTYPLNPLNFSLAQSPNKQSWLEVRQLHSILGQHLLVKTADGWQQIDPFTHKVINEPTVAQVRSLINDAIQINPQRYGQIATITAMEITTTTDVNITLNWPEMRLYQKGEDTAFINTLYKIHYLQWTGIKTVDKYLGILGLALVIILAALGVVMTFRRKEHLE
ncbi:MAG: hypothetical protein ACI9LM_000541 [Alteromonadaceae bacterium]|jgi:hypothetical protein